MTRSIRSQSPVLALTFLKSFQAVLFVASSLLAASAANAQALIGDEGLKTDNVEAHLVSDTTALVPGETHWLALHLDIRPHWHTYWRFGGDSGAPTTIDLVLPEGFEAGEIAWPLPKAVPLGPLINLGYEDEVFHLIPLKVPASAAPGATLTIRASAEWLVCSDEVCIPEYGEFSLALPVSEPGLSVRPDPKWGERIAAAVAALPGSAPFAPTAALAGDRLQIATEDGFAAEGIESLTYFPYQDGIVRLARPQNLFRDREGGLVLEASASYLADTGEMPSPLTGLLVLEDESGARQGFDIAAAWTEPREGLTPIAPRGTGGSAASAGPLSGLAPALLFAFIGGLILNLMPCVFPVLSMKALSFATKAEVDPAGLRLHGWIFTAGVLVSFLALAITLLALRAGGLEVGWGYQLQSPLLVLLIAYLLFAVGLALSGYLTLGASFSGIGDRLTRLPGAGGTFFTGVLASVVASPCTAPFMAAALGYAVMAPPAAGGAVFLALGFGLAFPYLLLSHVPQAFRWLPKPGPWMVRFKELLAFPMFATAAWLVWVLAHQAGARGVFFALLGMVLIAFAAWVVRSGASSTGWRWLSRISAATALGGAVALAAYAEEPKTTTGIRWEVYSEARLGAARSEGRGVFVDFTAAWCITCKVNEMGALASKRVAAAFAERDIIALRGDWTNRDAAITQKLAEFGRAGVPLYLYYAPGAGTAKVLPQMLTEGIVLEALAAE